MKRRITNVHLYSHTRGRESSCVMSSWEVRATAQVGVAISTERSISPGIFSRGPTKFHPIHIMGELRSMPFDSNITICKCDVAPRLAEQRAAVTSDELVRRPGYRSPRERPPSLQCRASRVELHGNTSMFISIRDYILRACLSHKYRELIRNDAGKYHSANIPGKLAEQFGENMFDKRYFKYVTSFNIVEQYYYSNVTRISLLELLCLRKSAKNLSI